MGLLNFLGKHAFGFVSDRCFERVDVDKNGSLDPVEIEVAILYLFNMLNKRMPGWEDPPSRADIQAAIAAYDFDGNKKLDKMEFREFAHGLIKTGPNTFFSRIGRNMITNTAVLPGAAWSLKKLAGGTPVGGMHLLSSPRSCTGDSAEVRPQPSSILKTDILSNLQNQTISNQSVSNMPCSVTSINLRPKHLK